MATIKSLVSVRSRATLMLVLIVVVVETQVGRIQAQTCSTQLSNLNVCAPFVLPGAPNANPSAYCCNALQAVDQNCLCSTLRISARLPSQCNLPAITCPS
ncbi:protein 108 [Camellia sinensis]|uniref:protein 108 n=1 Tax=Camellia sinensis TaxID=4442 RepID=UPI0010362697|nr:protein 108 [Camellia sinensis]